MWKRILLFALTGLILGTAVALFIFRDELPFLDFGDPVFTEEIPETRPKRLDRRELARFEGQTMEQILGTLATEKDETLLAPAPDTSTGARLLTSLPDAPLPFPDDARPADEKWLREFITTLKRDDGSEPTSEELWQFNLALAALQISPDQLPESLRQNTAPKSESDTFSVRFTTREGDLSGPFIIGNFDDKPDLEIIDQGGGRMNKVAGGIPVPIDSHSLLHPGSGLFSTDYDNDGDLDLYVIRENGFPDSLLQNDGSGKFTDVTIESGLLAFHDTRTAAWLDYDGDGLIDLLIGSRDHPLELYHQANIGIFQPVAWDLKLWVPRGVERIVSADISQDGLPDFFLEIEGLPDRLYANRPAENWNEWRFHDIIAEADLIRARNGSVTIFDSNNDGLLDLLISEARDDGQGPLALYLNEGDLAFREVSEETGLSGLGGFTSVGTIDMDNDGFEDLILGTRSLQANRVFWNRGGLDFREVSVASGATFLDEPVEISGRDLDQNGAGDLIYRNRSGKIRLLESSGKLQSWIHVHLSEPLPGAKISLIVRDSDWILHPIQRIVNEQSSFTIGLGEADIIESLKVFLPGMEQPIKELEKLQPDQQVTIELPGNQ